MIDGVFVEESNAFLGVSRRTIFVICGQTVARNGFLRRTKNLHNSSIRNFYLKIFPIEDIDGEVGELRRKGMVNLFVAMSRTIINGDIVF